MSDDDGWTPIGTVLGGNPVPQGWVSNEPEASIVFHSKDGITHYITSTEAAKAGYREVTNENTGERIAQFGLCLNEQDEWIYPPFRKRDETLDQMVERNEKTRQRLGLCRKSHRGREEY